MVTLFKLLGLGPGMTDVDVGGLENRHHSSSSNMSLSHVGAQIQDLLLYDP